MSHSLRSATVRHFRRKLRRSCRLSNMASYGEAINDLISDYSKYKPTPLTIKQFTDFARSSDKNVVSSFNFLRKEVPVRLANIMKEIDLLPKALLSTPSMKFVRGWYVQSFQDVMQFRGARHNDQASADWFTSVIGGIKQRHANAVEYVAQGLVEMKERNGEKMLEDRRAEIQYFLDRFYMSRISIRMLLSQHLVLFGDEYSSPGYFGVIDPECDVSAIVTEAGESVRIVCEHFYSCSPDIDILGDENLVIPYIPSHLYHIIFELLKNSFRAVVESESENLPPVKILIAKGEEDIAIKVSDEGGGVGRSLLEKLFHYSYSTAPQRPDFSGRLMMAPLAGYGYGLPLSRLYARYFNGELVLTSVEGHGTDVIVYLKVLSRDAVEVLPVFSSSLTKYYEPQHLPADWSIPVTSLVNYRPNKNNQIEYAR